MTSAKPIAMTSDQAQENLSAHLRRDIYSALLSGTGIRNIEASLDHEMQTTGFKSRLRTYINHLLRSGECTTFQEIMSRVEAKIQHDTQAAKTDGATNGVNGVNGHSKESDEYDLALPRSVTVAGARTVGAELEKVCEITAVEENTSGDLPCTTDFVWGFKPSKETAKTQEKLQAKTQAKTQEKTQEKTQVGRATIRQGRGARQLTTSFDCSSSCQQTNRLDQTFAEAMASKAAQAHVRFRQRATIVLYYESPESRSAQST
ncbi:hypothetical protein N0V90_010809 [Kalmusia sp. IMI 367209]|nr:hypothetical protein N0V90_010809 [Kalmusia sp. IMI 367209]